MKEYFALTCAFVFGIMVGNRLLDYVKESSAHTVDLDQKESSVKLQEDPGKVNATKNEELMSFRDRDRIERRQKDRKAQLDKVCMEICNQPSEAASCVDFTLLHPSRILVDDQHKVMVHLVAKSGETNLKRAMALASGKVTEDDIMKLSSKFGDGNANVRPSSFVHNDPKYLEVTGLRYLKSYSKLEIHHRLRSYFKFAFVRDPLERLLASFRAKILVRDEAQLNSHIPIPGRYIYEHYRNTPETDPHKMNYTFAEYLHYVADMMEQNQHLNRHWNSLRFIRPCLVNYDFIGHLGTIDEDAAYILHHIMGTNLDVSSALDRSKSPHGGRTHGGETGDAVRQYYSQVPPDILQKICKAVDVDSRMFGFGSKIGWSPWGG